MFHVFSTDYMLNPWCVRQLPPASLVRVVSYVPGTLAYFTVLGSIYAHAQLNPFYHPLYPDINHVRKDTRPFPSFPYHK